MVVSIPAGKALVQTVDILGPIVNDPFAFGRIAAANALSDVYAMGGVPWSAMSVACFPEELVENSPRTLVDILRGALDAMTEAGCVSAGGHTVRDDDLKFGLAVSGLIDPSHIAQNSGLRPGQRLILTKPLGTGVLATGLKASWEDSDRAEELIIRWGGRLNRVAGAAIAKFRIEGATDITGFGLGGHALELAAASGVCLRVRGADVPVMDMALEYASCGLVPAGSINNRTFAACRTRWERDRDDDLENILFDTQTSGGILMGVEPAIVSAVKAYLTAGGDLACDIGEVVEPGDSPLVIV